MGLLQGFCFAAGPHYITEYFTRCGGLFCVPAHTWYNIGSPVTMDMTADDANLGVFSSAALRSGLGVRSESPVHSMVVFGDRDRALDFVRDEPCIRTTTAPESCYGKLYSQGGHILLAGAAQNRKMKQTVELILHRSGGIDPLLDEKPIPQKWYCTGAPL